MSHAEKSKWQRQVDQSKSKDTWLAALDLTCIFRFCLVKVLTSVSFGTGVDYKNGALVRKLYCVLSHRYACSVADVRSLHS